MQRLYPQLLGSCSSAPKRARQHANRRCLTKPLVLAGDKRADYFVASFQTAICAVSIQLCPCEHDSLQAALGAGATAIKSQ